MKEYFINECLLLLKRDDIRKNLKNFVNPIIHPIISILLKEIYPYIYLSLILIIINFILHLGIFIILIRNKTLFK